MSFFSQTASKHAEETSTRIIDPENLEIIKFNKPSVNRYSLLTLIPKTIFKQFKNISFIWFLAILCIEIIFSFERSSISLALYIPWAILFLSNLLHSSTQNIFYEVFLLRLKLHRSYLLFIFSIWINCLDLLTHNLYQV